MRRKLLISVGVVLFLGVLTGLLLPAFFAARESSCRPRCRNVLRNIGLALHVWAGDHDDNFPPALGALFPDYLRPDERRRDFPPLACPNAPESLAIGYEYVPGLTQEDGSLVLAYDKGGNHESGRHVLFVSGDVRWMTESDFRTALARTREYLDRRKADRNADARRGGDEVDE
ncbi:MAG: hypothetical protein ACYS9X_32655 [Planctomycetota bacterium]